MFREVAQARMLRKPSSCKAVQTHEYFYEYFYICFVTHATLYLVSQKPMHAHHKK